MRRTTQHHSVYFVLICIALVLSLLPTFKVEAATGDVLRTINVVPAPSCGVTVGVAFDGSELLVSCISNSTITRVSPVDGTNLGDYPILGIPSGEGIGAISWDGKNNLLWVATAQIFPPKVYSVTLNKGAGFGNALLRFTHTFAANSLIDGLAYDGNDDSLWISADVEQTVYHYSSSGNVLGSFQVALGGCGNSGLVVASPSTLYFANNGCGEIYSGGKDGTSISLFTSLAGKRVEDLECDNTTFPGQSVIWSKDAYDYELNAFEVPAGECAEGGITPQPGNKVVVFLEGIATDLLAEEIEMWRASCQEPFLDPTFGNIKQSLYQTGLNCDSYLRYSYNGGSIQARQWIPNTYSCDDSGQRLQLSVNHLLRMLSDYKREYPNTSFILVGHSLGGAVALEALDQILTSNSGLESSLAAIITIDSPLNHVSRDNQRDFKKVIPNIVLPFNCPARLLSESSVAKQIGDLTSNNRQRIRTEREILVTRARASGIKVMTVGNVQDCLWNPNSCGVPTPKGKNSFWADESMTQVIATADYPQLYGLGTAGCTKVDCIGHSHGLALDSPSVLNDIVQFVRRIE